MAAHLISGVAGLDVDSATMMARNVLAAATTAKVWSDRGPRDGQPANSTAALARMSEGQVQLTLMMSILKAVRTNSETVPQSLRDFTS